MASLDAIAQGTVLALTKPLKTELIFSSFYVQKGKNETSLF